MIDSTGSTNNSVVQPLNTEVTETNEQEQAGVSSGIASENGEINVLEGESTTYDNGAGLDEANLPYPGREGIESQVFSDLLNNSIANLSKLNQLESNIDLDIINPFDGAVILSRMRGVMSEFNALLGIQTVGQSYSVLTLEQEGRLLSALDKQGLSEEVSELNENLTALSEERSNLESTGNVDPESTSTLEEEMIRLEEEMDAILLALSRNAELQLIEQKTIDSISTEFLELRNGSLLKAIQLQFGTGDAEEGTGEENVVQLEAENIETVRKMREEHQGLKRGSDELIRYNKEALNNAIALKKAVLNNSMSGIGAELFSLVGALQKARAEKNIVNDDNTQSSVSKARSSQAALQNDDFLRERITIALLAGEESAINKSNDNQVSQAEAEKLKSKTSPPNSLDEFTRQVTRNMLADGIGVSARNVPQQTFLDEDVQKSANNLEVLMALDVLSNLEQSISSQLREEQKSQKEFEVVRNRTLG